MDTRTATDDLRNHVYTDIRFHFSADGRACWWIWNFCLLRYFIIAASSIGIGSWKLTSSSSHASLVSSCNRRCNCFCHFILDNLYSSSRISDAISTGQYLVIRSQHKCWESTSSQDASYRLLVPNSWWHSGSILQAARSYLWSCGKDHRWWYFSRQVRSVTRSHHLSEPLVRPHQNAPTKILRTLIRRHYPYYPLSIGKNFNGRLSDNTMVVRIYGVDCPEIGTLLWSNESPQHHRRVLTKRRIPVCHVSQIW